MASKENGCFFNYRIEQELMAKILSEITASKNLQLASDQERQSALREKHVHVEPGDISQTSEESLSTRHDSLLGEIYYIYCV